ncbi:sensor histidine kinase [Ideonella sp. BN130291]|uniref:sensor histidine kinase n=1 Tax=Ideonella sp. BN130291 TaxID=3112940 RepID=UPI002E2695B2|nr:sensor histidine kinase N-terminal domain-containing protein [Ideonella sp. BN130291]
MSPAPGHPTPGPRPVGGQVSLPRAWGSSSLRGYLLAWIIAPIAVFVVFDTVSLYRNALASINVAYDRSLLASARSIGELLHLEGAQLKVELPYTALEIFDAGNRGRLYYRVAGFQGEFLSGYEDLPAYTRKLPQRSPYAALVDFYDADFHGEPVRVAALYQPVASHQTRGLALIQVAETLEVRQALARDILLNTLLRQALLITVVALVTWFVVARALRPVEALRRQLIERAEADLSPVRMARLPLELQPVLGAINDLMQRLQRLMEHQRQFVRDASHQLRTPLAVLKTQVQNALATPAGTALPREALQDMHGTVERATRLANQMLALAKVEQVQAQGAMAPLSLTEVVREVALDVAPLIAAKALDFELDAQEVSVIGHDWMLRELTRNLVHNAVRETPAGGRLELRVDMPQGRPRLLVRDSGPGLKEELTARLFEPFHTGHPTEGSGLGLAICRSICDALGADLTLENRHAADGAATGLDAEVRFRADATAVDATIRQ